VAARVAGGRPAAAASAIHLFVAGPNAFTFFVWQHHRTLGRTTLYEFDFEGQRDRSYRPSLTLPLSTP